jgi:branched-chain amino acid transport system ATP-binding protein
MTAEAARPTQQEEASTSSAILRLEKVIAGYGSTVVLRGVDLDVATGSVTALLGANGAGKTTLLHTVAGLVRHMSGRLVLEGADVSSRTSPHERTRRGLCLIPEGRGIFRELTVRDNIRLQVPPWRKEPDAFDRAVAAFPVLGRRMTQIAGSMSGGEQQMLALARAYLSGTRVVLLDEVSMGLAPQVIDEIFASFQSLTDAGITLLLVEQYVSRALELASWAFVLSRGEVVYQGRPSDLDEATLNRSYFE